ncbi:Chlamydia CHLPS protein (DUF818)/Serine aminopeptidase, S33, putative [Angomonas deanei]|uniref:Chlamydia CHLPS protein (DUF818)/Serine aminopeptidase, S33, putative n=1 Tax=Angomonas deanei TaxID=59799 RepID=A0A7G2CRU9_9TRYP|nr:Chlamydia CHLPS protein (DUF818)/Serine aminopeptidase, S33, putative [Angomonas deanei]
MLDILLAALSVIVNFKGVRLLPQGVECAAPALGWLCSAVLLRARSTRFFVAALTVQSIGAALCARNQYTKKSLLALRMFYLPLCSSFLSLGLGHLMPRVSPYALSTALISQSWAALGGLVVLMCYPATIFNITETQEIREARFASATRLLESCDMSVHRHLISSTITGRHIDSVTVRRRQRTDRWVVYVGGNAEIFEDTVDDVGTMGDQIKSNFILLNPRGIGRSTGFVSQVSDLVEDTAAVVKHYVETESIDQRKLLFIGHSIGGGIAAEVVAKCFPDASLVLDRTFSSLSDAAVCFSPLTPWLTKIVIPVLIGDLKTMEHWEKINHKRKVIIFSKRDEILKFDACSPARLSLDENTDLIELHGQNVASWHNCPFKSFREKDEIYAKINEFTSS